MVKATFQPLTSIYNIAILSTTLTSSTLITTFSQKSFDLRLRRPERKILFAGLTLLTSFFRNYGGDLFLEAMSLGRDVVQKKKLDRVKIQDTRKHCCTKIIYTTQI